MIKVMENTDEGDRKKLPDIVLAAYEGDVALVSKLLVNGADPNSLDPADNLTLLHIACMQGDKELVDVILEHDYQHGNVDFTVRSSFRPRLAWQFAANGNFLEISEQVHSAAVKKDQLSRPSSPRL